jgi:translation initiation factor IF-2
VNGSLEAVLNLLETYAAHDQVKLDIVHFECGYLTPTDIELAQTFKSIIYCFNVEPDPNLKYDKNLVKIKHFNIIYKLFDDLKEELGQLAPQIEQEVIVGEATVQKTFEIDEKKTKVLVAGGVCTLGQIDSRKTFKVMRPSPDDPSVATCIFSNEKCKTLKHMKADVATIKKGVDFGLTFDNRSLEFKQGDRIVCYETVLVNSTVEWDLGF